MTKKMPKVALLYTGGQSMAGIEYYLQTLMLNSSNKQCRLELLSLGNWKLTQALSERGLKVKVFNKRRLSIKVFCQISKYLIDNQFDLVVSHGSLGNLYARLLTAKTRIPNISTAHSKLAFDYDGLIKWPHIIIDRLLRGLTTHYLAVSEFLRQDLINSGVSPAKISQVYNGVELKAADCKHTKDANDFIVGSIGRLHSVKNYQTLIKAMSLVKNQKIKLVIAGQGVEQKKLEKLIVKLGLEDRVRLLGYVADLNSFFSLIDLYIQPSRIEGFGLAVVEAMLAGKLVLVSPVGSLPEIVVNEQTGFVLDDLRESTIANCLDNLSSSMQQQRLKEAAHKGQKLAQQKFEVETFVKNTIAVYKKVIKP